MHIKNNIYIQAYKCRTYKGVKLDLNLIKELNNRPIMLNYIYFLGAYCANIGRKVQETSFIVFIFSVKTTYSLNETLPEIMIIGICVKFLNSEFSII